MVVLALCLYFCVFFLCVYVLFYDQIGGDLAYRLFVVRAVCCPPSCKSFDNKSAITAGMFSSRLVSSEPVNVVVVNCS